MEILIADGLAAEDWFDKALLQGPSGKVLTEVARHDAAFWSAIFGDDHWRAQQSARWRKAQAAELAFWRTWRENILYAHISLEAFWDEVIEKTGGPLGPGRTLDIGCGPVSVLNYHRHPQMKPIGLDPLGQMYASEGLVEAKGDWQPIPIMACPAEKLPFTDASLDQVVCFNVLDHVSGAPDVLDEMIRVLKPGGEARVYVHTFAWWIKRLLFFDTPHVYHWDHQEFHRLLVKAGFEVGYELKEPKTFDLPDGLMGKIKHFPYWFATKVCYTSYFKLKKPRK